MILACESMPMRLSKRLGLTRVAWALRRLHCPVAAEALVLEVGSGGNPYARANVLLDAYEVTGQRHWVPLVSDRPTILGFVESLPFKDKAFDFVIAHNGLHHCASPHRGLLEMHRVARKGVLVFEPRDSLVSRLGVLFGLGQDYETAAVALSYDRVSGGWRNGPVPNYVYRWTEREIEKVIRSATPWMICGFRYFHATRPPSGAANRRNPLIRLGLQIAIPLATVLGKLIPSQTNCFAFLVTQPPSGQGNPPWIRWNDGVPTLDPEWARREYRQ